MEKKQKIGRGAHGDVMAISDTLSAPNILVRARKLAGLGYYGSRKFLRELPLTFRNLAPTDFGRGSVIQCNAEAAAARGRFLGGPASTYHALGAHQLVTLLEQGLEPSSRILDVGCGCLRAGYWLMQFLDKGNYFGIEPNKDMLVMGLSEIIPKGLVEEKAPHFDHNDSFDFGVFAEQFDFVLARSVWSHAAPSQIDQMLSQFARHSPNGVFLTSYCRASLFHPQYAGTSWVGRSHQSNVGGFVYYRLSWIRERCKAHGLKVIELKRNIAEQIWLRITKECP